MISPIIHPIIKPVIRSIINPDSLFITRYFSKLDPVLNSHYELASPITFTGDMTFNCGFVTTSTSVMVVVGRTDTNADFVAVNFPATGKLTVRFNTKDIVFSYPQLSDGKYHELEVSRSGTVVSVKSDGALLPLDSSASDGGAVTLDVLGKLLTTSYFDGILANPKFTDKTGVEDIVIEFTLGNSPGDGNTENSLSGNNSLTYINIPDANKEKYTLIDNAWIGKELFNQPVNLADMLLVGGVNNVLQNSFDTTTSGGLRTGSITTPDNSYLLAYDLKGGSSGFSIKDSTTGQGSDPNILVAPSSTSIVGDLVYTATKEGLYFRAGGVTTDNIVNNISVKRKIEVAS